MVTRDSLLVTLVKLVDRIPMPPSPPQQGRGRPKFYSDRLFLKALIIMIVRHLPRVHELLTVLAAGAWPLSHAADVGAALAGHTQHLASTDWLCGTSPGRPPAALGHLWSSCGHR